MKVQKLFSIAPMMKYSDRHFRYLMRILSPKLHLYSEMISAQAIIHGNKDRILAYNQEEHPVALQLGGSDPTCLAQCAKIAEDLGYDEVNLNIGCPSQKVRQGAFGVCLMEKPDLVAQCVNAMKAAASIPVTIKCRIGINNNKEYAFLHNFVRKTLDAGTDMYIVHARIALMNLKPKDNRSIPPLHYERVYQLKSDFPSIPIIINGGINTVKIANTCLDELDGIMIGRASYQKPWFLHQLITEHNLPTEISNRIEWLESYIPYVIEQNEKGISTWNTMRHLINLFDHQANARQFRTQISSLQKLPFDLNYLNKVVSQTRKIMDNSP